MKQKKRVTISIKHTKQQVKRTKQVISKNKFSKRLLVSIGILFISLFIIVIFSSQQQIFNGNAATAITPTFGTIGDCQTNGTCPTGSGSPAAGGVTISPGSSITTNPTNTTLQPCTTAQNTSVSTMSKHRSSKGNGNNGFMQLILQFLQQLLQLLQQLLGGGTITTPGTPQPPVQPSGVQPNPSGVQPTSVPNTTQTPCPPTNAPQPTNGSAPTAQPTGTQNQKCAPDSGSAAANYNWGCPTDGDEFNGTTIDTNIWNVYNSAGNGGNGLRRPSQITESGGIMIMSGTANATTGGMKSLSNHKAQYGRWEVKMRVLTQGSGGPYHPVIALVPYGIPYDGTRDVDFAETNVGTGVEYVFIHYNGLQDYKSVTIDIAQWHYYAIEVAPNHVTWFVDGKPIITDTTAAAIPPYTMEMNVQLDANQSSGLAPSQQEVDFFRYYPLPSGGAPIIQAPAPSTGVYK